METDLVLCQSCKNTIPSEVLKEFDGDCPWCMSKPEGIAQPTIANPLLPADEKATPAEVIDAPDAARFGRFIRTKLLGAGGMGEVWKAWDPALGRWVALKFLKTSSIRDRSWFRREAHLAATLSHPNIAAIHDLGEDQGLNYIAMQFVEGLNLEDSRPVGHSRIATVIRDAARGVAHAHENGIAHRDLKPSNIMVTADAHVYVTDFGLARRIEIGARTLFPIEAAGTPVYMAPEQATGEALDARADVYSLGATLYELLSGRPPIDGSTAHEMLRAVIYSKMRPLPAVAPDVPRDLASIVMKCLAQNRDDRYPTARELADDLDRWLEGRPVQAHSSGLAYRTLKFVRRHLLSLTAAVAFLLAGLGVAGVLTWQERRITEQAERLCREGEEFIREKDDRRALDRLTRSTEVRPLAIAHLMRGFLHYRNGRYPEAVADCDAALKLDPDNEVARENRDLALKYLKR